VTDDRPRPTLAPAVALLSAAALAYEILLIRLFAIVDWHHIAFLVISLALLGYGASGTFLALAGARLVRRFDTAAAASAASFGGASFGAFLLAQRIEMNSLEIFWSARQFGKLFLLYLLFAVPFFCAATAIGLALTRFGAQSARIYRADLVGAGLSAAAVTALLFAVHPVTALQIVAGAGFAAAALFAPRRAAVLAAAAGIAAVIAARPLALPLRISQFKELSQALRVPGARVIEERSGPLGLLTAVVSPEVPFRHAPGLSLSFAGEIPAQVGVFSDGGGMTPIAHPSSVDYLDFMPTAVAYHIGAPRRRVAVIGAGGGTEVMSALAHGAEEVTAVEVNPRMAGLVTRHSRGLYADRRVRLAVSEGRRFIRQSTGRYDVIQIALLDSLGSAAAGVQALSESYLYTVESMTEMIEHLAPGGVLVVTRWMQVPPREVVKLFATAVAAQEQLRAPAARRLALIRGWNTATLVVKNGDFDRHELAALRRFCDQRSFDIDYAPGVARGETNRVNILEESYLFDAAAAILGGAAARDDFFDRYKFNVRPATDERPYFFHVFRWRALPELLRLRARGGMPLLEWGYLVLVAGLLQALLASVALILVPLLFVRRGAAVRREPAVRLIAYFGAIGLAFLFVEIAFMQRLTLFLGHPLYAVAVVLSSFLFFSGIGSGVSARVTERRAALIPLIVAGMVLAELLAVRALTAAALDLPASMKIAASVAVVAPLAFVMGMPFPLALRRLASHDPAAIPWAWSINGTASVLSSMLATLIAVHFGFSLLVASAALLYGVAALAARSWIKTS